MGSGLVFTCTASGVELSVVVRACHPRIQEGEKEEVGHLRLDSKFKDSLGYTRLILNNNDSDIATHELYHAGNSGLKSIWQKKLIRTNLF